MQHQIGKARFEILENEVPYVGKPIGSEVESVGQLTTYKVDTSDLSSLKFGIVTWPDGASEVIPQGFLGGEKKYEKLATSGRWTILNSGSSWIAELNAMKFNPERALANLATASYEQLCDFAEGDITQALSKFGSVQIGTRAELHGETNKNRNRLALKCEAGNHDLIAAGYVITRVLAILKDYGM